MTAETDEQLVIRAQEGSREAFAQLVDRWADRAFNLVYRMLGNVEDTEDVVQEGFLNAFRSLGRFKRDASFGTWIYRIMTNGALVKIRKSAREVFLDHDPGGNGRRIPEGLVDWTDTPLDDLINRETRERMDEAIEALPLDQRTVLVLRDVNGFPAAEVAEVLGISVPAVKSRLHRARVQVRDQLAPYLAGVPGTEGGVER